MQFRTIIKKALRPVAAIGIVGAVFGTALAIKHRRLFTVSDVTTGETPEYPELRAHVYYSDIPIAVAETVSAMQALPSWQNVSTVNGETVVGEASAAIAGATSDITVNFAPLGSRHVRAIIRSKSRTVRAAGDMGDNARFIRQLQNEMDRRLVGG